MLKTSSPACQPSPWGYSCARMLADNAVLHYSVGGPAPSSLCAGAAAAAATNATQLPDGWVRALIGVRQSQRGGAGAQH